MMGARLGAPLLVVALLLAPAGTVAAAPAATVDEAGVRFDRGVALYAAGDYAGALAEFEAAQRLAPRPALWLNIGVTARRLFRYGEAIVALQRYLDQAGAPSPERRREVEAELAELRSLVAEVQVRVDGGPAELELDGRALGTSPLPAPLYLAPGDHTLRASRPDCEPAVTRLQLVSGQRLEVALTPRRRPAAPATARLTVATRPPGAALVIDGRAAGRAPWAGVVAPGGHEVSAALPDHEPARRELLLSAGQERTLVLDLSARARPTPLYKRWYVWTAVALVAAGAVAAGVGGSVASRPQPDLVYPPR